MTLSLVIIFVLFFILGFLAGKMSARARAVDILREHVTQYPGQNYGHLELDVVAKIQGRKPRFKLVPFTQFPGRS